MTAAADYSGAAGRLRVADQGGMSCGKGLAKVVAELRRLRRLGAQYARSNTIPQASMCLTRVTGHHLDFGSKHLSGQRINLDTQ
jgi:hypothetical protein